MFCFKQKTAYEMRISDWSSDVCSSDLLARTALDRLCLSYGAVAGDLALAHGPHAVVLAGGLTQRMRDHLPDSGFHSRFTAKGRFESLMGTIPVRLAVHEEIGLFGAAAAFRERKHDTHGRGNHGTGACHPRARDRARRGCPAHSPGIGGGRSPRS